MQNNQKRQGDERKRSDRQQTRALSSASPVGPPPTAMAHFSPGGGRNLERVRMHCSVCSASSRTGSSTKISGEHVRDRPPAEAAAAEEAGTEEEQSEVTLTRASGMV